MARLLLAVLLPGIVALGFFAAQAQSPPERATPAPGPPAPPSTSGCQRPARGGETVSVSYIAILEVTLPESGEYSHGPFLDLGQAGVADAGIQICHAQTASEIRISAITGREVRRKAGSPAANALLDEIAAGARLRQQSDVTPINTASSPPPGGTEGLRYRLQVFGRDPTRPATDGTRVSIYALPRPRQVAGPPVPAAPCAEGVVTNGRAEIVVWLTQECPAGLPVSITLFIPGEFATSSSSEPAFEWRAPSPGEPSVVEAVVRPIPPNTGGSSEAPAPARITPPITGSGGLIARMAWP